MNLRQDRIASTCERLGLHRMAVEWTGLAQDAARKEVSYADFLEQLLAIENGGPARATARHFDEARDAAQRQDARAVRFRFRQWCATGADPGARQPHIHRME
jgi:IstB-like ATP binding protein